MGRVAFVGWRARGAARCVGGAGRCVKDAVEGLDMCRGGQVCV